MERNPACRICDSSYTLFVQNTLGNRTKKLFPQWYCMDCQGFFHTSGYREDTHQKANDFQFLFRDRENHAALQSQLALELITRLPGTKSVLEIGHGAGLFLKGFGDYGVEAVGFELNEHCHKFATEELKVKSTLGYFDDDHEGSYDLIVSLQVFEHLEDPRSLFEIMKRHLNPDGAIYLSVPFVERHQWKFLKTAASDIAKDRADVFADNDVHITHFSIEGMKKMGLGLGARSADYFVSTDVYHKSPGAYHGVIFHF